MYLFFSVPTVLPILADGEGLLGMDTVISILPILLFIGVLYFFFRRLSKVQRTNVEQHRQHTKRVEELLERIAVQLERQGRQ